MEARLEQRGSVALITLSRPQQLNAVNGAVSQAVGEALTIAEQDDAIRVIVLTGEGRAFSAGADLGAVGRGESTLSPAHPEWGFAGMVQRWINKPVIAAINGLALGGGAEIVLACDLAVIDEEAVLGFPEVARGLISAGGGVIRLPQQIPQKVALELLLIGDSIGAARAHELGLVNRVAPPGAAIEVAIAMARSIACHDPVAVQSTKAAVHEAVQESDWQSTSWTVSDRHKTRVFAHATARRRASKAPHSPAREATE